MIFTIEGTKVRMIQEDEESGRMLRPLNPS